MAGKTKQPKQSKRYRRLNLISLTSSDSSRLSQYWGPEIGGNIPDVSLQLFEKYRLRYLEYGNWLSQKDRQERIELALNGFATLSKLFNSPNIGLDGMVSLSLGGRGQGGRALAHFEPNTLFINLTKEKGSNSLAHEYAHALDYILGMYVDRNKRYDYLSGYSTARTLPNNTGGILRKTVNDIVDKAIELNRFTDGIKASSYWTNRTEIFARIFEQYVSEKYPRDMTQGLTKTNSHYLEYPVYWDKKALKEITPLFEPFRRAVCNAMRGKGTPPRNGTNRTIKSTTTKRK